MMLDDTTNKILIAAYNEATSNHHEYMTPEHLLFSALFFNEGIQIIENCGGHIEKLKKDITLFFKDHIPVIEDREPIQTLGVQNIIQNAANHCFSAGKDIINVSDIIIAIFSEKDSFAAYVLKKNGLRRLDILRFISHGVSSVSASATRSNKMNIDEDKDDEDDEMFDEEQYGSEEYDEAEEGGSGNQFLKAYALDLVEKARQGKFDPLVGREDIIQRTVQILSRRVKNNPIHVGDPGVGKTAITEGLATLIAQGKAPAALRDSRLFSIDMGSMVAGTKYRGDFEERIKKVLHEIEKFEKAIVYIDEIHTVVGAGAVSGGSMDASNILKPFLTNSSLRFIGSTTYEEYRKHFEKDRALSRRFQKVEVPEPSIQDAYQILLGLKDSYESFHRVKYTEEALKLACELSAKYINDRHLPDKAIDVIDEAGAFARLAAGDSPDEIEISGKDVEKLVSTIAKIPAQSVTSSEVKHLKNLDAQIKKQIFGQETAIDTVVRAIKRSRAGFNEGEKPVASLLFVGPTGVGKTEVARQLSKIMGIPLVRFDMSEYQEKHTVARLIGAPPGYVGFEEGGLLTETMRKTPHCVLLLDEIEKAHPDIFNVLLQVMDYATLTDNNGKKADFRNIILIMTSNAGAREIGRKTIGFENKIVDKSVISKEVERIFSPEFRNRLDDIVVFNHISEDMALSIARKAVKEFSNKLKEKNIKIKVSSNCYKWLAEKGLSSVYGAREILRLVQDQIKTYFVDEVLFGKLSKGGSAVVDVKAGELVILCKE